MVCFVNAFAKLSTAKSVSFDDIRKRNLHPATCSYGTVSCLCATLPWNDVLVCAFLSSSCGDVSCTREIYQQECPLHQNSLSSLSIGGPGCSGGDFSQKLPANVQNLFNHAHHHDQWKDSQG
jgi:hypothetical protein